MTVILGLNCGIADWVEDYGDYENARRMHLHCFGCSCECHWDIEDED